MLGLCHFIFATFSNEKVFTVTVNVTVTGVRRTFWDLATKWKIIWKCMMAAMLFKMYFCKVYPACVSSKLCEFIGLILNWKGKLCISLSCRLALYTAPQFSQQAKTILDMYRDLINVELQKEVLPQPKAKCLYNRFSCEIFGTEILFIGNICD